MAPLIILLVSFGLMFAVNKFLLKGKFGLSLIGRISMALMLIATGIAHFTSTDLMIEMMPEFLPAKREIVHFTGICELLAVFGLLWDKTAKLTSVMLIIFFSRYFRQTSSVVSKKFGSAEWITAKCICCSAFRYRFSLFFGFIISV